MKKILMSMLVTVFLAGAASAQEKHGHRKHKSGREVSAQLNLTQEQKDKMKSLRESYNKEMVELKKNDQMTVKDMKAKQMEIRKRQKSDFQAVLTAEQKSKMKEARKNYEGKRKDMGEKSGAKFKEELGLSNDQSAKLDGMKKNLGVQMKAIRTNESLSPDQKKSQSRELLKKHHEEMKSVLTAEQQEKMKQMHKKKSLKTKKNVR